MAALILGIALGVAAAVLAMMRNTVIRHVTSRSLGSLAPGYAATPLGYSAYVSLVGCVSLMLIGIGIATWSLVGVVFFALALLLFVCVSVLAIVGEVRVYRALKR